MTKGKDFEADYFLKENSQSKHKQNVNERRRQKKEANEKLRKLHFNKCPKCGHDLETKRMSYIDIDQCSSCGVIVLIPENVDKFVSEEASVLKTLIDFFNP